MNEKTKNILSLDPIAIAETLIGKRHDDWDLETEGRAALELAMLSNQVKEDHLKSIGDTHFGITWHEFIEIAKAYGFKCGFCQKFTVTGWSDECIEEEEIIFFHEEKGFILHAESYGGNSVNSARVYGEVKLNDGNLERCQWDALHGFSHGYNGNGTMHFDVDVREGFRFHLDAVSDAFELSTSWSKVPFLWLLNYMEENDKNCSYEKINKQKIAACTAEVRKIIFG